MPPGIVACGAGDGDRVCREYRRGVKQRAVMFAAVKAVAQTNPVGPPRRQQPDLATETAAGEVGQGGLWGWGLTSIGVLGLWWQGEGAKRLLSRTVLVSGMCRQTGRCVRARTLRLTRR